MLLLAGHVYTEVCDPATMRRVRYGQRGTPVYTHLERTSQPMIRLVSGDLTLWEDEPTPCGRTYPRLPQGIFGRIDDMFTIRGENVYPSEIDAAVNELARLRRRASHRHHPRGRPWTSLLLRVEGDAATTRRAHDAMLALPRVDGRKLQTMLGLRTNVEVVEPGSIARTDFKARRVIDDREVFPTCTHRWRGRGLDAGSPSADLVTRVRPATGRLSRRLISRAEPAAESVARRSLDLQARRAARTIVGITGVPGSGKSTLVAQAAGELRAREGGTVGDRRGRPVEPLFSGGAILGDRIRMQRAWPAIPASSSARMATRGASGGLARATLDAVDVLDVAGFDMVIVETVGVGQDEVEIVRAAHTTDRRLGAPASATTSRRSRPASWRSPTSTWCPNAIGSDANRTIVDLKQMLMLALAPDKTPWTIPVIGTSAVSGRRHSTSLWTRSSGIGRSPSQPEPGATAGLSIAQFRLGASTAENMLCNGFAGGFRRARATRRAGDDAAARRARADAYADARSRNF